MKILAVSVQTILICYVQWPGMQDLLGECVNIAGVLGDSFQVVSAGRVPCVGFGESPKG